MTGSCIPVMRLLMTRKRQVRDLSVPLVLEPDLNAKVSRTDFRQGSSRKY